MFQPEVVTSEAILLWVDFWRRVQQPAEAEAVNASTPRPCLWLIFSPRQLLLLAQSTSPRLSWTQLTSLVLHLLMQVPGSVVVQVLLNILLACDQAA